MLTKSKELYHLVVHFEPQALNKRRSNDKVGNNDQFDRSVRILTIKKKI